MVTVRFVTIQFVGKKEHFFVKISFYFHIICDAINRKRQKFTNVVRPKFMTVYLDACLFTRLFI